jgi:hypothetical protein
MPTIYGTIGYTLLNNINYNNNIIIFSDMHDTLTHCANQISVSDWFETKFKSSKILLEEVPREGVELKELWLNAPHTQKLKKLFINNQQLIHAVDIRPHLIPFSWELIIEIKDDNKYIDITFKQYIKHIDLFFCLESDYFINKLVKYDKTKLPHTKLGKHFMIIKKNYGNFLQEHKKYKNISIKQIYLEETKILDQLNNILDEIMEWYICANIDLNKLKPIILHTGLVHSEKVIRWLVLYYNYIILNKNGINTLNELSSDISGCVQLPDDVDKQFGGFFN